MSEPDRADILRRTPMEDAVLSEAARPLPHDLQLARAARAMHFEVLGA